MPEARRAVSAWTRRAAAAAIAGAAMMALTSCGSPEAAAADGPQWLIRMAVDYGGDHPGAAAGRELARMAERESEGRIRIRVYEDGYLGDESEVVEQLRFGGIDLALVSVRALESLSLASAALGRAGALPDRAAMAEAFGGKPGMDLAAELERQRLLVLAWDDSGPECYLVRRGFSGESLEGLRLGVDPYKSAMDAVSEEGAMPVALNGRTIRRALESGMVDGARTSLAAACSSRLDAEYLIRPIPGARVPVLVVGSKVSLQKMPAKDRAILFDAITSTMDVYRSTLAYVSARASSAEPWPRADGAGR